MSEQRPYIGGQAVIEGVMMRSPSSFAVVCRRKNGELMVREQPFEILKSGPRTWPFFRGVYSLVESLRLGSRALRWSAELYEADLTEAEAAAAKASKVTKGISSTFLNMVWGSYFVLTTEPSASPTRVHQTERSSMGMLPILLALGVFVALPQMAAEGLNRLFHLGLEVNSPGFQAITGISKLVIVVGYLLLIRTFISEIRRVFQYHGAEHMTISTYEANEPLDVEHASTKTTMHARCGTTFLVMVALVSIVIFSIAGSLLPKVSDSRLIQNVSFFVMKLPFLPVIAAITFEIQRFFARYCSAYPLKALLWPGFLVQKITTAPPDASQLEVALASLRTTLWREAAVSAPIQADRTFSSFDDFMHDPGYTSA